VAIEPTFGRLKHEWALLPLRIRGMVRREEQRSTKPEVGDVVAERPRHSPDQPVQAQAAKVIAHPALGHGAERQGPAAGRGALAGLANRSRLAA
jgi:hypothetical protein